MTVEEAFKLYADNGNVHREWEVLMNCPPQLSSVKAATYTMKHRGVSEEMADEAERLVIKHHKLGPRLPTLV